MENLLKDDKLVLTISGGKAGTVRITRLVKDDKLHVEQVSLTVILRLGHVQVWVYPYSFFSI